MNGHIQNDSLNTEFFGFEMCDCFVVCHQDTGEQQLIYSSIVLSNECHSDNAQWCNHFTNERGTSMI